MASGPRLGPGSAPGRSRAGLARLDALHLSGYSLMREPIAGAAVCAAALARAITGAGSASTSRPGHTCGPSATRCGPRSSALRRTSSSATSASGKSWARSTRPRTSPRRARHQRRGDDYPARTGDVVDTTGAGDALAAGFLVGGPELALDAAARCVAGRSDAVTWRIERADDAAIVELGTWRYEAPYDFYDGDLEPPNNPERFFVARDDGGIVGFYYFEPKGDVLEYGLGLRPILSPAGASASSSSARGSNSAASVTRRR